VIGYPYDQAFVAEMSRREDGIVHNLSARSDGFWSEVITADRPLSGFSPDSHFLLKFYPSFPGERPDGYSGAGVWAPGKLRAEREIWSPDPLLTGIQTHAYRNSELLRVVKSATLRLFLEQTFPVSDRGPE
jgi:hypothetical protein